MQKKKGIQVEVYTSLNTRTNHTHFCMLNHTLFLNHELSYAGTHWCICEVNLKCIEKYLNCVLQMSGQTNPSIFPPVFCLFYHLSYLLEPFTRTQRDYMWGNYTNMSTKQVQKQFFEEKKKKKSVRQS